MKEKRFKFPKGKDRLHIPFLLDQLTPWQQQVIKQMEKTRRDFGTSKSSRLGFEINEYGAEIIIKRISP